MKKRILALALALSMFGSSLFAGSANDVAYAYNNEQVLKELRNVENQNKLSASAEQSTENDLLLDAEDFIPNTETEEKPDNILNPDEITTQEEEKDGVQAGEDAAAVLGTAPEVQPEAGTQTDIVTDEMTEIDVTFKEVDADVDLITDAVENTLLNEETVSDDDIVDVIIVFDNDAIIDSDPEAEMNFLTKIQINFMEVVQSFIISRIEKKALDGDKLDIEYQYTWLLNGVATSVPYGVIDEIEKIDGVKDVILQSVYEACDVETVDPASIANGSMVGRDETWASGYTGEGIKIAIIDTGIDEDHQSFQAMSEDKLTENSATKETVAAVLSQLNASTVISDLSVDDVYWSNKIVYAFNYADGNLSINHEDDYQGDHGTHVAGIAAANKIDLEGSSVGVAPDAQLYIMKVFGQGSGATTASLLAAVEDSMILGADVINMSVGSAAGFTSDGEKVDEIYAKIAETGTVLAVSAGNSATSGLSNIWGTNQNLTSNPDNATVSSPGTYVNVTTVASVDNVAHYSVYFETLGEKYGYLPASYGVNNPIDTIFGTEYEYVMVPNCGQTAEDFAAVDCEGKIAVVQRGVTTFYQKCDLAEEAGAVACIIYNNEPGEIGLNLEGGKALIPCVSVTMATGEQLAAALEKNPEATITFAEEEALVESSTAYEMSSFSSWGVSPDLKLEPDIAGPGGNIYSTTDEGTYGYMSGTSMSSPNVAGLAALLKQYVRENYPELTASESRTMINALLMSTARLLESGDVTYSPRVQGAGLANAYLAINSNAYLSVDGMDLPKVELYDDPEKTGTYNYTFNVKNFGDSVIYYSLDTTVQTEGVDVFADYNFISSTPVVLDAVTSENSDSMVLTYDYNADKKANVLDAYALYTLVKAEKTVSGAEFFRYNVDNDEDMDKDDVQAYLNALVGKENSADLNDKVLEVKAGETAKVSVNVNVSDTGKAYMDENFENGIFVEGYTILTAESVGDVDLSLPYMGFYGDWTQAPLFDSGFYWDLTDEEFVANQYVQELYTQYTADYVWYPGWNPYAGPEGAYYDTIAFSPNGDMYGDYIEDMYLSLLRNADTLTFTYTTEDGTVVFEDVVENAVKTIYREGYAMVVPYVYSWYSLPYDLTDAEGNVLPNNTKLTLSIKAELDYDKHESNNTFDEIQVPIMVDLTAPELLDAKIAQSEDGSRYYLQLLFDDNHAIAGVSFLTKSGTIVLGQYLVEDHAVEGEEYVTYDITGYGDEFMVVLGDYAFNESTYMIEAEGNDPELDESALYGYRTYDDNYYDDSLFGWIGIDKETAEVQVYSSEYYMDYAMVAAEYVGGYIVGVDANKDLVAIRPGYWDERIRIASIGSEVRDMAFDPTTETLYALHKDNYCLVSIDVTTGEVTQIGSEYSLSNAWTLACDDNGQLYAIDNYGRLKEVDKATGEYGAEILNTSKVTGTSYISNSQSMTYDSANDCIYWAHYAYSWQTGSKGVLYKIDLTGETPEMTAIGTIAGNAEVVGLLCLDGKGFALPTDEKLQGVGIEQKQVALLTGDSETLKLALDPWYGVKGDTTWTSADENVAVVSERGVVTATGVGETTITVKVVVDETTTLTAAINVKVVNPTASVNGYALAGNTLYNQWVTIDAEDLSYETHTDFSFTAYTAGEYVDGTIYVYGQDTSFYKVDAETYEATMINGPRSDYQVVDMSYDYSTGYMYAIAQDMNYGTTYLAQIDTNTGEIYCLGEMWDEYNEAMCALAVSTDGTIYAMSYTGILHTVEVVSGEDEFGPFCELTALGYVGCAGSMMLQSMTYDHNAEDPALYWTMISYSAFDMMYIDLETVTALDMGAIDGGAQITCTYIVPEEVPALPVVNVTDVTMKADAVTVLTGASKVIPVEVLPLNATDRNVVWTVADENVAAIKDGMVIGVGEGTTTATGTLAGKTVTFTITVLNAAEELRGYLLTDMGTGDMGFWIAVDDRDLSSGTAITDYADYMLYAGAYYNGKLYGYGVDMETYDSVYVVADEVEDAVAGEELYVTESMTIGEYPDVVDMAFDYTEGVMYAVAGTKNVYGANALYCVNLTTGQLYKIGDMTDQVMTLACTADGQLYGVGMEGTFYAIDKYTAELTIIAETGIIANQYQSMTYDYNSGNLYWAQIANDPMTWMTTANLYIVNPEDGSLIDLGRIGMMGAEVSALHTIPKEPIEVGAADITGLALPATNEILKPQDTITLSAVTLPVSVTDSGAVFTYTSDNPAVATVDTNGVVTAVAAGSAKITVEVNGITATCTVNVVDDTTKVQVMTKNGWQVSPLLNPSVIDETVELPAESGLEMAMVTYADGWYYALDTANAYSEDDAAYQTVEYSRGYLWRFNEDLSVVEKVSDTPVYTTFTNLESNEYVTVSGDAILDIFTNPFTGEVYVLGRATEDWGWGLYYQYHIYKLDVTTGTTTFVGTIGYDIASPQKMEFISEDTMVAWDHYNDYVYTVSATEVEYGYLKNTQLVWAQDVVASNYDMAMVYHPELDVVFVATVDTWIDVGQMGLYILDPNKKTIEKYENAAYDAGMIDLVFGE